MSDDRFDRLFADLDAAHHGALFHERVGEYGDLVAGEFADNLLVNRLAGAIGAAVELRVAGERMAGTLREVGSDWCRISDGDRAVVNLGALESVRLRSSTHASTAKISVLSMASPLREWAAERRVCRLVFGVGNQLVDGTLDAVARDYVQLRRQAGRFELVPLSAIALVREAGQG